MYFRGAFLLVSVCLLPFGGAMAQDVPPNDVLAAIVRQLISKPVPTAITFDKRPDAVGGACRLRPAQMNLTRDGRTVRSFSVLIDNAAGSEASPREFFTTLTRVAIDSDGAGRTYHPEDPLGSGVCQKTTGADGKPSLSGICALDQFSSGGAYLFSGSQKLSKSEFVSNWADMWPRIRDKALKSVVLRDAYGPDAPKDFYFFHWRQRGLTAFFRDNIIPRDREGYPCRYKAADGPRNGYFISSTTLENKVGPRADGCAPGRYVDSETVPFIVLPKGGFGKVRIGDVAIARLKDRVVYGIVGDAGPATKLGEGSIALNAMLLGKYGDPFLNMKDTWTVDIQGPAVSILVLGDTKAGLKGNYSPANVEAVARHELARWNGNGDPLARFEACRGMAPVNRSK
jgi:hypothetical protein